MMNKATNDMERMRNPKVYRQPSALYHHINALCFSGGAASAAFAGAAAGAAAAGASGAAGGAAASPPSGGCACNGAGRTAAETTANATMAIKLNIRKRRRTAW